MKFQFSAGGIVYKKDGDQIKILLSKHSQHHGWVFPKGLIGDKEENKNQTKEETAIREVKEETGIEGEIEQKLLPVSYWFVLEGEKIKKTVYYFIMKFVGGNISIHDDEMEEVEWIDYNNVSKRLTYSSDKEAWKDSEKIIVR